MYTQKGALLFIFGFALLGGAGCAGKLPSRPCTEGGELAREGNRKRVTKQCFQRKEPSGRWVNDGPYIEWHANGKRALAGEYQMGRKSGKWQEWDAVGKLLWTKYYVDGKEVPRFDTPDQPVNPLIPNAK